MEKTDLEMEKIEGEREPSEEKVEEAFPQAEEEPEDKGVSKLGDMSTSEPPVESPTHEISLNDEPPETEGKTSMWANLIKKLDVMKENPSNKEGKEESLWDSTVKRIDELKFKAKEMGKSIQTEAQKFGEDVNKLVLTPTNKNKDTAANRNYGSNFNQSEAAETAIGSKPEITADFYSEEPEVLIRVLVSLMDIKKVAEKLMHYRLGRKTLTPYEFSKESPKERADKFRVQKRVSHPTFIAVKLKTREDVEKELEMKKEKDHDTLLKLAKSVSWSEEIVED